MNTKDTTPSGVSRSPTARPMTKLTVGLRNCRKPMVENGSRRAVQENSARGTTVTGPTIDISSEGPSARPKMPCRLVVQPQHQ